LSSSRSPRACHRNIACRRATPQSSSKRKFSAAWRVHDLPSAERMSMLRAAAGDGIAGARIYDAHIAEVARSAGANVVVTDNRRHFLSALRYGLRVETPAEFLAT